MQINNRPNFVKSFMVGLVASSAGAFIALPGSAMPEPGEAAGVVEETSLEAIEPTAEETLPVAETADEADAIANVVEDVEEALDEAGEAVEGAVEEADEAVENAVTDTEDTVEEAAVDTEDVVEEAAIDTEEAVDEAAIDTEDAVEEAAVDTEETVDEAVADTEDAEPITEADALMEVTPVVDTEASEDAVEADAMSEDAPLAEEPVEATEGEVAEDMDTEAFTITELTGGSNSFTVLAAALEAAELSEVLSGEGPFTVFAPTDEAFADLPEGAVEQLLLPENKDVLIQVLTYHVVPGAVLSTELETGNVATVEGSDLDIEVAETAVTINNANVVLPDVAASNGVIHVIDRVILPPAPEADANIDSTETVQ